MGTKSKSAPDPNPGIIAQANVDRDVSMRQLDQARQFQDEQMALARPVVQQQLELGKKADARGDDQWAQYINTFKPVEEKMASDAMGYDSSQEMERRANQAGADVESQFDGATAGRAREMAAMGINPASGRFGDNSIAMAKAAAKAGTMNQAREGVRDRAIALRSGVAAFGRNQPNYAGQTMGQTVAAGNSAVGNLNSTVNSAMANVGTPGQWGNSAVQAYMGDVGARMQGYNAQQTANAGMMGGLGTAAGMFFGGNKPWIFAKGGVVGKFGADRKGYADGGMVKMPVARYGLGGLIGHLKLNPLKYGDAFGLTYGPLSGRAPGKLTSEGLDLQGKVNPLISRKDLEHANDIAPYVAAAIATFGGSSAAEAAPGVAEAAPGVGDAGAFDQAGSAGVFDAGGKSPAAEPMWRRAMKMGTQFRGGGQQSGGQQQQSQQAQEDIMRRLDSLSDEDRQRLASLLAKPKTYAGGGVVEGPGTETSDSVPAVIDGEQPAALSTGEAVLNKPAVEIVGEDFVHRVNKLGLKMRASRQAARGIPVPA